MLPTTTPNPTDARRSQATWAPLLTAITLLICTTPAHAHAFLDHADPKVGSTLPTSPPTITIWFTDTIQPAQSSIEVFNAANTQIDKKDPHGNPTDPTQLTLSLPPNLPPGTYKVTWHALCPDGHKTSGSFTFTIK